MAHARGVISRVRAPRRSTEWGEGPFSTTIQSVTTATKILVNVAQDAVQRQTIVRLRGSLTIWIEVATSIGDGFQRVAAGIGIVTADAATVGVTAMPSPFDMEWPGWIWHTLAGPLISLTTTEDGGTGLHMMRIPIDSKAMRKFHQNETLFGMLHFSGEVGAATATFAMDVRLLAKLA